MKMKWLISADLKWITTLAERNKICKKKLRNCWPLEESENFEEDLYC